MRKIILFIKWKYLRWKAKQRRIFLNKSLVRMYWIQELEKLPQYNRKCLVKLNYNKLKRLFVKEFPDKYLHNPYKD